ncbi:MAG TPA: FAD-dependent oxidoreductase [Anaeromyxobacteraceae bacterium]|jgi:heterodisulfide reductase subunit A|nr:FAD-dependent oxidoreductase [Anaeromyxobacteraceae bacterium]
MHDRSTTGKKRHPPRTGIFFCRCGPNIGALVDLDRLAAEAWPAAHVSIQPILCSEDGKRALASRAREARLDRAVIVACSPREHEATFCTALETAGLDPALVQVVDVREAREWLGGEREDATRAARSQIAAAVARVALHEPLPRAELDACLDVLVVGGGPAGLSAALALAQEGRQVILAEREHALGGAAARLDHLFPSGKCASCALTPAIDAVLHHERIRVITGATLMGALGSLGRFVVQLRIEPRGVDAELCLGCAECSIACPVQVPARPGAVARTAIGVPWPGAIPHAAAIYWESCLLTQGKECDRCARACAAGALRFDERPLLREVRCGAVVLATGAKPGAITPTPGLVGTWDLERALAREAAGQGPALADPAPRTVLLAPAPGAHRDGDLGRLELLKLAGQLAARLEGAHVAVVGACHRAAEAGPVAERLAAAGVELLDAGLAAAPEPRDGRVRVPLEGGGAREVDLLVLHPPSEPAPEMADFARRLRLGLRDDGFVDDQPSIFEPVSTAVAGVYAAGAVAGPRPAAAAARDGAAAAGRILSTLSPWARVTVEGRAAQVDLERCAACGSCRSACPHGALRPGADGRPEIDAPLCRACASCAAACPTGAMISPHYTREQLGAELEALLTAPPALAGEPSASASPGALAIDTCGLPCPHPVFVLANSTVAVAPGTVVEISGDCETFEGDVRRYCQRQKKPVLAVKGIPPRLTIQIQF